ncbi:MAG: hypothetical protein HYV59_08980 [Planctomycetes bacterium]|nr:hypothetical protein [Planctomycetota bacterium]
MSKNTERMTKKDVCRAFSISLTALDNWILKGCPVTREGRNVFFSLKDIIEWREQSFKESQKGDSDFEKSRAEKELWRAKTVKLNYERLQGRLIYVEDVQRVAFEKARLVRDSLLCIPSRVSDILAGEINKDGRIDKAKVNEILTREIRQALENLSGGA